VPAWVVVVVTVALVTIGALAVVVLGLIRHVKLLARSLQTFREEVEPLLEDLRTGSAKATDRMQALEESRDQVRDGFRSGRGRGARMRTRR
jgi:hypothetical protein